ncbi:MAG: BLUF domain-containing protein, partial [Comamonadaceae bacterium]
MTSTHHEIHEILYCSQLAPGQSPGIVGNIVTQARARNAERGITGLLVFDGHNFCQHLEGPSNILVRLMNRIGEDPR